VESIDALVSKILADLIDTFQAPHDEALEVELVGDSKVKRPVQCVVFREERTRCRPTIQGLKGWCFNFQEVLTVQKAPKLRNDLGPGAEYLPDFGIDCEIGIALTVPDFLV
jgi:hypothetical protein